MSVLSVLFSYDGRIGRRIYWLGSFGVGIALGVLVPLISVVVGPWFALLALFPAVWCIGAINAKRLHDIGKSGWWQLLGVFSAVISIAGIYAMKDSATMVVGFGLALASLAMSIWSLWISIKTMFFAGEFGSNDYGDPPTYSLNFPDLREPAEQAMASAARTTDTIARAPRAAAQVNEPAKVAPERRAPQQDDRRKAFGNRPGSAPERRSPQHGFGRRAPV